MPRFNIHNQRRRNKGQTLVIAIMVMFILAIVATVFIALIARNLFRAGRFSNVDAVAQYAEAGIRYADKMLTTSENGADWRPEPDNLGSTGGTLIPRTEPVPDANWQSLRDRNPDFKWVRAYWPEELPSGSPAGTGFAGPSGGYTTYNTGDGRFLLRVSYEPNPNDPLSKHIKLESIGRWGVIDNEDPTTWASAGNINLRREITAFKPIGVTDYLRFVTNKDNRSVDVPLGCPGFQFYLGRSSSDNMGFRGAPIRVNGNLIWHAANGSGNDAAVAIFLRRGVGGDGRNIPIDRVEVAGDIKVADPDLQIEVHEMDKNGSDQGTTTVVVSDDTSNFNTVGGLYRDGRDDVDKHSYARGVKRIDPPLIDQADPTEATTRYRLLTLNSGERIRNSNGSWRNLGQLGWGRGVYINNQSDDQPESETLVGGYTLRADWLKPNSPLSTNWKGQFYIPPGAVITLNPGDTDGDGQDDFTITRTDISSRGQTAVWYDAWGDSRPEWGRTITMPYPRENTGRTVYYRNANGSWDKNKFKTLEGNGVIYAEGNIRIRGMLPENTQLTIVSDENIYIEGNLLKYREKGVRYNNDPWRGADNRCGLAILARKNVVVNTTMFLSPMNSLSATDVGSDGMNGLPPFHVVVRDTPESQLRCLFDMGPWESSAGSTNPYSDGDQCALFLRHSGQYGPSYINAWMNPNSALPDWGILSLNTIVGTFPPFVYGVGAPGFNTPGSGVGSSFAGDVFPLTAAINAHWADTGVGNPITMGIPNLIQLGLDQTTYVRNNYQMGGIAVQPMDVRIEAILYAQEGSFFVIPGPWFNPNPDDVPGNQQRPAGVAPEFPYFGQPLDIRIIVDGAISENLPAAVGDVEHWMSKWGKIPEKYGSSNKSTAHPNEGLTVLYDDHVGWPLSNLSTTPIRWDRYGRPLPIVPRLPVSGSLVYFGDVM